MNRRETRKAAHDVVAFQLQPANKGFWLEIQTSRLLNFELDYFALGVASYQRKGDVRGKTDQVRFRQFIDLGFDVMLVGITSAKFFAGKSRRGQALKVLGTTGRATMFEPIRPSDLLARGTSRSEIVIPKQSRRPKHQGCPYAGPYWAYAEYMYQPGLSTLPPSRQRRQKAKKKKVKASKKKRRKD